MGKGVPCDGKRRQKIDTHIACSFIKRKMWAFDRHRTCNCVSGQCQLKRAGQEPKRDVGKAFSLAQREGAPFPEVEESIS